MSLENQSGLVYANVMGSSHFSSGFAGRDVSGNVVGIEGKSHAVGTVYVKDGRDMVYATANRSGKVGIGGNTPDGVEYQVLTKQATTSWLIHGQSSYHLLTQLTCIG